MTEVIRWEWSAARHRRSQWLAAGVPLKDVSGLRPLVNPEHGGYVRKFPLP